MSAKAGLCLAWSVTPQGTFCRVVAHIKLATVPFQLINLKYPSEVFEPRHDKMGLREFLSRPDTNRPAQPQKLARVFKFRLIWVFAGRTGHFVGYIVLRLNLLRTGKTQMCLPIWTVWPQSFCWFCHEAAHIYYSAECMLKRWHDPFTCVKDMSSYRYRCVQTQQPMFKRGRV